MNVEDFSYIYVVQTQILQSGFSQLTQVYGYNGVKMISNISTIHLKF